MDKMTFVSFNLAYKFNKSHFSSIAASCASFDNPCVAAVSLLKFRRDFSN